MNKEIDHEFTKEIVCPHCGYEFEDSYELADPDREQQFECNECSKDFLLYTYVSLSYTTKKK
jgi:transposase-like protein